jgi:hypothetical protein
VRRDPVKGAYTLCAQYGFYAYSPWMEAWFQDLYGRISDRTACKEDRCYMLHRFVQHALHLEGDLAECGVYRGGTAYLIARLIDEGGAAKRRLHLFDTFAGMPRSAAADPGRYHREGDFGDTSLEDVRAFLDGFAFVDFHPGVIPRTFEGLGDLRFALVHLDVDLYQSTRDCCRYFYERMTPGGVMLFDNYGYPHYAPAEKKAVDEFFADRAENPISLGTTQCLVIKQ